jgi:hypothetical protein
MGPQRLHVGFGNGSHDTTQVVWGEGGAAANAPDWLRDAAQLGWGYAAGAPVPQGAAPQTPSEGEATSATPPESTGGLPGQLDELVGALVAPSARRPHVRLDGARRRRRHPALPPIAGDRRTRRGDMGDSDPVCPPVPRRGVADCRAWRHRPHEERRRFRPGLGSRCSRPVSRDARRFHRPWDQRRVRLPSSGCGCGEARRRGLRRQPSMDHDPAWAREPHSGPVGIARRAGTGTPSSPVRRENSQAPGIVVRTQETTCLSARGLPLDKKITTCSRPDTFYFL